MNNVIEPGVCHWCGKDCGGTCLQLTDSTQMKTNDPAYWMLKDGHTSTPEVHQDGCYICEDPEFAQMGLPLCKPCPNCTAAEGDEVGHVPADDTVCSVCGVDAMEEWYRQHEEEQQKKDAG